MCRPMLRHTKWINEAIPYGPYLPHGAFCGFFTSSWVIERWNLSSVSLLCSLFLKSIRENMILYYYGSSTLCTRAIFLVCVSSPRLNKCSLSSYPLKAKYVEHMGKGKAYNSSHVYCQAKGWSKKSWENFLNDFGKGFWNGVMEGENGITSKRIFKVEVFFSSQNIDFPFHLKRLLELFFFPILFFSIFFMLHLLRTRGFWWYLRRESRLQKLHLKWLQYTSGGRIFRNGVMHANMAKPWLWRWGSCGYIGGGCIFWSGGMHDNISRWG
jgi:hypothetical protein